MNRPKRSFMGKVVEVVWSDAFDDSDVHPQRVIDEYIWHTYGKVIRETDTHITVATSEGGDGPDAKVFSTTILWPMVQKIIVRS